MNWIVILWPILISASSILALIHLFIWSRQPQQWAHLAFSLAAMAVAAVTLMEYMAMLSVSIQQVALLMRWVQLPILVFHGAVVYFMRFHFHAGRPALAWATIGLRSLAMLLGFTSGQNLFFKEITGLKPVAVLGGETISVAEGIINPWYFAGPLSALLLALFVLDAAISICRRGSANECRDAKIISAGIIFFVLGAPLHTVLVHAGLIDSTYIIGLAFMPTVIAMSYLLSCDILHSVQLARQLAASDAELLQNKQRMNLAADAAVLGLWEWDIEHDEIWITDKGRALFGIPQPEQLKFEHLVDKLCADDREPARQALAKALAEGQDYESEYRIMLPQGRIRWLASRGRIEYCKGNPVRMHGVIFDITRRKHAELEALRQREELAHLSRVTLMGELSGSLAHELNQPLAAILSNAQAAQRFLAQGAAGIDEIRDILDDIVAEDTRAGEVIRHLRQLFKRNEIHYERLDLHEAMQAVLKLLHSDLVHNGVAVDIDLPATLPAVMADKIQVQQVLLNLLHNGCDAMTRIDAAERRLSIGGRANGAEVEIAITDRGQGIPADNIKIVFEPFFTTKTQGMGLGLPICRSIIAAHGGRMWVESNGGCGAKFRFTLPIQPVTTHE